MTTARATLRALVGLGLTELEAEVYAYLVENAPATGYRIAKGLGKPTANTYKAVQSLREKGAVIAEDGRTQLCRCVPVPELLDGLERRFRELKGEAEAELARLKPAPEDERIYHLRTPGQVFERFHQMFERCERVALLDLFPPAVARLKPDIESATARGILVAVKVYDPVELAGADVVLDPDRRGTLKNWPACWANGVFDGRENLLSLLSADARAVRHAVWSGSVYMSWVYHSAFMFELMSAADSPESRHGRDPRGTRGQCGRLRKFRKLRPAGYAALMNRLGPSGATSA